MSEKNHEHGLVSDAARMLVYRSGWYSTKLHLALIMMALVTCAFWRMGFPPDRFETYCIAMNIAAGIYSGSRVGETFAQRGQPAQTSSGGGTP